MAGANRSGTTLMSTLLSSHPNIAMSFVEPNLWTHFYRQYGGLGQPANFECCFNAMLAHKGVKSLNPEPNRGLIRMSLLHTLKHIRARSPFSCRYLARMLHPALSGEPYDRDETASYADRGEVLLK